METVSGKLEKGVKHPEREDRKHRGNWSTGVEFLLSCISISVGLGNVWRFPSLAYDNGGGAFLIPYFVVLFLIGKPVYYFELCIGQFSGRSMVKVWSCVPALRGIGIGQMLTGFYFTVFYTYIMSLTLFYIVCSMQAQLPWAECDATWADDTCYDHKLNLTNETTNLFNRSSAAEQFFYEYVLKDAGGLEGMSSIDWRLVLSLFVAWMVIFLSLIKGVQSLGKVVYVTASYPYLVLISLLIVAVTREGAAEGIIFFFKPKWSRLLDIKVWYKACEQSFFSLNAGFGQLVMYASYNEFRHNVYRDALIISLVDTLTSILAGSVVFAVLGTLAYDLQKDISTVVRHSGLGLAFVAYPEALGRIPVVPQLWSVLFFVMLFLLGLGTVIGFVESILTVIKDEIPKLHQNKATLALGLCLLCFLGGLPLTTNAGLYVMYLLDNYCVGAAAFLYAIFEISGVMYIYGWRQFCNDVHFMLGFPVGWFWKVTWVVVAPFTMLVIYVYGNVMLGISVRKSDNGIPSWGEALGWVLAAVAWIQIPVWMVIIVNRNPGKTVKANFLLALQSKKEWGPKNLLEIGAWKQWNKKKSGSDNLVFYCNPRYSDQIDDEENIENDMQT
ncbi:LOW QUALITY PROTEIN: sodium-dependent nutrient amino acid transporter 1-like [Tachypleus tridentatus]|uniref:LOW QUALITY PROTEIN: sodium-dependent nutrient amino acid transporter 1-like n=1 Tax=Tachypleus tridentatus TaxID=6853 RepID=UPI003FD3AA78